MPRSTIADLARHAGVSISTVDRVLNGRNPVRSDTARRVAEAAEAIGFHAANVLRQRLRVETPKRTLGFLLQQQSMPFFRELGEAIEAAAKALGAVEGRTVLDYSDDLSPTRAAERLLALGGRCDAVAVATADHPLLVQAAARLQDKGIPVFAAVSDLGIAGKAGFVGVDNRSLGRTAAWLVTGLARGDGPIAIQIGSHRYMCQEAREMGFRSFVREYAPEFRVMEPILTLEDERYAYQATMEMLDRTPDLRGLFVAGGGVRGVLRALREAPATGIVTVCVESTEETRAALLDHRVSAILAHPVAAIAARLVEAMVAATGGAPASAALDVRLPFEILTPENVS